VLNRLIPKRTGKPSMTALLVALLTLSWISLGAVSDAGAHRGARFHPAAVHRHHGVERRIARRVTARERRATGMPWRAPTAGIAVPFAVTGAPSGGPVACAMVTVPPWAEADWPARPRRDAVRWPGARRRVTH
jgi:hypothetical protein